MSARKHKRRRLDIDVEPVLEETDAPHQEDAELSAGKEPEPAEVAQEPQPEAELDAEASAKEREVWDAFREEQYELLEQLPLSLHRAFTLIHELDQQAQDNITHITPAILKYVSIRKTLAATTELQEPIPPEGGTTDTLVNAEAHGLTNRLSTNGKVPNGSSTSSTVGATPGPSTRRHTRASAFSSLAYVVQSSTSTRELLIHIARSAEEVTRACAEKVYLAQHAYDLVDRYIRDLDRAIKEQEASISLGLRPGTHPASIILPEVVAPPSTRGRVVNTPPPVSTSVPAPILVSPLAPSVSAPASAPVAIPAPTAEVPHSSPPPPIEISDEPSEVPVEPDIEIIDDPATNDQPEPQLEASEALPELPKPKRKGKKRKRLTVRRRPTETTSRAAAEAAPAPLEEEGPAPPVPEESQPPLTLRIPAQVLVQAPVPIIDDMPPDPNEPRYCFCNQVSFGDMIACDNPTCAREWFHIGCVGLTKIPKGKWFCRECAELRKRPKSRKRAR
ncbi:hypothetical protein C8Q79DRAFT_956313 [Trametes meyenii]|nr:hypothetical protein C8Q79DRAFT_956313 [Trametes meyenii]